MSEDRLVYEGDVDMVVLPGIAGEMGILPNHAPLLSNLKYGLLKVKSGKEEIIFTVAGGVVEVQPDVVTILADAAESVDEIDISRAEAAKKRAENLLKDSADLGTDEYLALEAALRRSNLRLDAVKRYRKRGNLSQMDQHERRTQ